MKAPVQNKIEPSLVSAISAYWEKVAASLDSPSAAVETEDFLAVEYLMAVMDIAADDCGESEYAISLKGFSSFYKNGVVGRSFLVSHIPSDNADEIGGIYRIEGWDNGNIGLPPISARWCMKNGGRGERRTCTAWSAVLYGDAVDAVTFASFIFDSMEQWEYQLQVA